MYSLWRVPTSGRRPHWPSSPGRRRATARISSFLLRVGVARWTNGSFRIRHPPQERLRSRFVEQLVEVPALRRLGGGGEAVRAGTARPHRRRVGAPALEPVDAALCVPAPACVAVIDEDGRAEGLVVEVRREPAD